MAPPDPNMFYQQYPVENLLPPNTIPPFEGYDLKNDIHPIFAQANFPGARYESLVPALRLASKLLTCDASLRHWHAICHGHKQNMRYPPGSGLERHTYQRVVPKDLNAEEKSRMLSDLKHLAPLIKFKHKVYINGMQGGSSFPTSTCEGNSCDEFPTWRNWEGTVCYSEWEAMNLHLLHRNTDGEHFPGDLLLSYADFAVFLCHEVAHVGMGNHCGRTLEDIVIGDNKATEAGFAWESAVFGGLVGFQKLYCTEWPHPNVVQRYLRHGYRIFVSGRLDQDTTRCWRMPKSWALQLFTTHFWQEPASSQGLNALLVPQLIGRRLRAKHKHCECTSCYGGRLDGRLTGENLRVILTVRAPPVSPRCKAGNVTVTVRNKEKFEDVLAYVPQGYALLSDGTIVLAEHVPLVAGPEVVGVRKPQDKLTADAERDKRITDVGVPEPATDAASTRWPEELMQWIG